LPLADAGQAKDVVFQTSRVVFSDDDPDTLPRMNQGTEKRLPTKLVMSGVLASTLLLWAIIAAIGILLVRLAF